MQLKGPITWNLNREGINITHYISGFECDKLAITKRFDETGMHVGWKIVYKDGRKTKRVGADFDFTKLETPFFKNGCWRVIFEKETDTRMRGWSKDYEANGYENNELTITRRYNEDGTQIGWKLVYKKNKKHPKYVDLDFDFSAVGDYCNFIPFF
jgi:hypothetical protein